MIQCGQSCNFIAYKYEVSTDKDKDTEPGEEMTNVIILPNSNSYIYDKTNIISKLQNITNKIKQKIAEWDTDTTYDGYLTEEEQYQQHKDKMDEYQSQIKWIERQCWNGEPYVKAYKTIQKCNKSVYDKVNRRLTYRIEFIPNPYYLQTQSIRVVAMIKVIELCQYQEREKFTLTKKLFTDLSNNDIIESVGDYEIKSLKSGKKSNGEIYTNYCAKYFSIDSITRIPYATNKMNKIPSSGDIYKIYNNNVK